VRAEFPRTTIDHDARLVSVLYERAPRLDMRVPTLFGEIYSAELRGGFVLVLTEGGRVSFHVEAGKHRNLGWKQRHSLAGKMHWHSIKNTFRQHCILPELRDRVAFHITHSRYSSGGRSSAGAGGSVRVDKQKVLQCSPTGCRAHELGAALAQYLYLQPEEALASDEVLVASLALLDRRLPEAAFLGTDRHRFEHPMWISFYDLRASHRAAGEPGQEPG
jgi:hypothetical protein